MALIIITIIIAVAVAVVSLQCRCARYICAASHACVCTETKQFSFGCNDTLRKLTEASLTSSLTSPPFNMRSKNIPFDFLCFLFVCFCAGNRVYYFRLRLNTFHI